MNKMVSKSLVFALTLMLTSPVWARQTDPSHSTAAHSTTSNSSEDSEHYRSKDGSLVHRPSKDNASSERVTAECWDGTHSYSHSHRGTCSHHGGVAQWK